MSFLMEHTKLWFCWLDIIAFIILIAVIAGIAVHSKKRKDQQRDLEDRLSEISSDVMGTAGKEQ